MSKFIEDTVRKILESGYTPESVYQVANAMVAASMDSKLRAEAVDICAAHDYPGWALPDDNQIVDVVKQDM